MLTRIRIEVEAEDSAAATEQALSKYEHALQVIETERHAVSSDQVPAVEPWAVSSERRKDFGPHLGREVTDEVIEYDPSIPGYKGRRVVQFRRLDGRTPILSVESPNQCGITFSGSAGTSAT